LPNLSPLEQLRAHLDAGFTGCITQVTRERVVRVYVLDGAVVAAHATDDDAQLLRRLLSRGELDALTTARMAQDRSVTPLYDRLLGVVEDRRLDLTFFDRFRDNIAWFACSKGYIDAEEMESILVPNVQLSHDTGKLLQDVETLLSRTQPIRDRLAKDSIIQCGENPPSNLPEQEITSLLGRGVTLRTLLDRSPFEHFETLDILGDMFIANSACIGEMGASPPVAEIPLERPSPEAVKEHLETTDEAPGAVDEAPRAVDETPLPVETIGVELDEDDEPTDESEPPPVQEPIDSPPPGPRLRLSDPALSSAEAKRKIDVANEVLRVLALAFDHRLGTGSGSARIQLLVDGTRSSFSSLYLQTHVSQDGAVDASSLLRNLRRRPSTEHRRLVNEGLSDLLDRLLTAAMDDLPDAVLDDVLLSISGYQQRIGL
jgi:hypothetical protein